MTIPNKLVLTKKSQEAIARATEQIAIAIRELTDSDGLVVMVPLRLESIQNQVVGIVQKETGHTIYATDGI